MKNIPLWLFLVFGLMISIHSKAQEIVPYSFSYKSDGSNPGVLKKVANINYSATKSIRIYFKKVELAGSSYILLKNSQGHNQKLDSLAMTEWDNSSAYFNGNTVEMYLMEMEGQKSSFEISSLRISSPFKESEQGTNARTNSQTIIGQNSPKQAIPDLEGPYKLATGRFTNGNDIFGTGWIAPNGAIVTSHEVWRDYIYGQLYDVIEFNIPPANDDGSINHPGPEDQYPLKVAPNQVSKYFSSKVLESIWTKDLKHHVNPGFAILRPMPNSLGQLPGERQQEYFKISENPNVHTIKFYSERGSNVSSIVVSIVHHGINFHPATANRTPQFTQSYLRNPEKYIEGSYYQDYILKVSDRQQFLVYSISSLPSQNFSGGPVLIGGIFAIGVHSKNFDDGTAVGYGFRPEFFRKSLGAFMTGSDTYYLDAKGPNHYLVGRIDKPFLYLESAIDNTPANSILNISEGHYSGSVTIDKPMKLIAPVGKVVLGTSNPSARMAYGVPYEEYNLAEFDDEEPKLEILAKEPKAYPNPFSDKINIEFSSSEIARVNIQVYDMKGNIIGTIVEGQEYAPGSHSVVWDGQTASRTTAPKGLYVVLVQVNHTLSTFKVIKN